MDTDLQITSNSSVFQILQGGDFMDPQSIVDRLDIHPGMRIADFGSGSGFLTLLFAQKVADSGIVTAIDIMQPALDTVISRALNLGLTNINAVIGNLEVEGGSGLADETQDMVVLANILFQNDDKSGIVKEAKRVLKTSGKLVVIDWKKNGEALGPPNQYRTDIQAMKAIVLDHGLEFDKEIDAGKFHYGLIFRKIA